MEHRTAVSPARIELRLRLPLIWLVLLALAAILVPDRIWTTLLIGLGGFFALAFLWAWVLSRGLHATRQLRFGWVAVGDRLSEQFTLTNNSALPALWVEIEDQSTVPGYQVAVVRSIGERDQHRWRESAICQQRGQFTLGPWAIRSGDPFGIFNVVHEYPASEEIVIHPPIHGKLPIPLPMGQSSGRVRARQRSWQATVNAASVRDYRPNDPERWIHWPTSARRDALYVREFDLDAAGDIWLLLDMETAVQLGSNVDSTEEHAVLLAAALTARALQQNRAVGLAAYGQTPQIVPTGRGQGQRWKLLRALALVQADGDTDLAQGLHDLGRVAQRGAAAVIITSNYRADWLPELVNLAQRGVQSNVILLDRPSFGGAGNSENLRQAIRRLGFTAQIVRQGEVGQPLEEREKQGYWEFKVTPSGRAVAVNNPLQQG